MAGAARRAEPSASGTLRDGRAIPGTAASRSKTLLGRARPTSLIDKLAGDVGSFRATDALDVAKRAQAMVRGVADAKSVEVRLYCTCSSIRVQPLAFSLALRELVENAVHATPSGWPVIVQARDTEEGDVLWQVEDTGNGMSESVLAELGRTTGEGSGLGVAFAWAVIEEHGGLLRFESAVDAGTMASIWLPGSKDDGLSA